MWDERVQYTEQQRLQRKFSAMQRKSNPGGGCTYLKLPLFQERFNFLQCRHRWLCSVP
jgi:hypothetical protein